MIGLKLTGFTKGINMVISYNELWKLLIDKNMQKKDLVEQLNISSATLAKMSKGGNVSLEVIQKNYVHIYSVISAIS